MIRSPGEYVRELIRQGRERRLGSIEQDLIAAAKARGSSCSLSSHENELQFFFKVLVDFLVLPTCFKLQ